MVNQLGLKKLEDEYSDYLGKFVYLYTMDGPIIGKLKGINLYNYIISPHSDLRFNDQGVQEWFLNEKELSYKKIHVRGIKETSKKSIENYLKENNKNRSVKANNENPSTKKE